MNFSFSKLVHYIKKLYVIYFERLPYINWFNPLMTLYLNFRSFPLRQAWKLPVFVYGRPMLFSLYGDMECKDMCKCGMVRLNQTNTGMPNNPGTDTAINNWGKIIFHGKCEIFTANKINVARDAVLELGAGTKIMCMCNITAHKSVHIGAHSRVVHRCQVMDSNFHFIADFVHHKIRRYTKPVYIGNYCWICNSSTVAAGSIIPNKTIVASNSLVNKDMSNIPEESMIGGIPAKHIATGFRRVESFKLESQLFDFFYNNPEEDYYVISENASHSICDCDDV